MAYPKRDKPHEEQLTGFKYFKTLRTHEMVCYFFMGMADTFSLPPAWA